MRSVILVLVAFASIAAGPSGRAAGLVESATAFHAAPANPSAPRSPCLAWTGVIERADGIPPGLLTSISFVESVYGNAPWPWALNIAGAPYYPATRDAAARTMRDGNGHIRPDLAVGCMQILMKAHAQVFAHPEDLLDPRINVAYAGWYLAKLHGTYHSWTEAVAHYGAIGLVAQTDYVCKVLEYRILFGYQPLTEATLKLCRRH